MATATRGACSSCAKPHRFLRPQPGPQQDFFATDADVTLYGGAAGGGKSWCLLVDALKHALRWPGWVGVIFRLRAKDIAGDDAGLWKEAHKVFAGTGAVYREGSMMDWRWGGGAAQGGATLLFRHLKDANFEHYRGQAFAWIGIDEAVELDLEWIIFLMGRMRTMCGSKPRLRMTCNPDPAHPLASWVKPYLLEDGTADRSKSGEVRWLLRSSQSDRFVFGETRDEVAELADKPAEIAKSFTFIPSLLADNRALEAADPNYRANIQLQGAVLAAQLGDGNWLVEPETGGMLSRALWGTVRQPIAPIVRRVRAWDKAATKPRPGSMDPDFTVGVLMEWDVAGRFYVTGLVACREEPPGRDRLIESTAMLDGPSVVQVHKNPGGDAGKSDAMHTRRLLAVGGGGIRLVRESKAKVVRAQRLALELARGMRDGKVIELGQDATGVWEHRGYILDNGWLSEDYSDAGSAPATLGQLFWSQVSPFWDPAADHDDVPDAMADAHEVGSVKVKSRRVHPRRRAALLT